MSIKPYAQSEMETNKDIYDKLPIHLTEQDLKNNPKCANLLLQLEEKLCEDGSSRQAQRELGQAERDLSQARQNWFVNHILHHELGEMLAELEVRNLEGILTFNEKQLKDILSKTMALSEIKDYLHFLPDPTSKSRLFGLSEDDIERQNPVQQHLPALQQTVLPMLENRLRKKCEDLYSFYKPAEGDDHDSEKLLLAKSQSLPGVIEHQKVEMVRKKESICQSQKRRSKQFWLVYQKLLESLSIMEKIIKDFKLTRQARVDDVTVELLKAKSDALCLKIRLLQIQILCETYTAETVRALKKISLHLDDALKQHKQELANTSHSLQSYHAVGAEFKSLVHQFTQLQKEIENRKWGLQQLTRECGEGDGEESEEVGRVGVAAADTRGAQSGEEGAGISVVSPVNSRNRDNSNVGLSSQRNWKDGTRLTKKVSFDTCLDDVAEK